MARVQIKFDGASNGARKAAAETRAAVKGVGDQADRDTKRISLLGPALRRTLQLATVGLTLFAGASVVAFKKSIDAASNLAESVNAVNVVFGTAAAKVHAFAKVAVTEAGLSMRAFNELVTPIGAMLQNTGYAADEAAEASINLAKRAADMASVFNVDVSEALGAIQAGLRGEADPLERFGVGLSAVAVEAKAMAMGLAETKKELDANARMQARLALLMEQTNKVAGDFVNTSDGFANSQKKIGAALENVAARIGGVFLPAVTSASNAVNKWLQDESNVRMLERWAETLQDGVATALRGIAGWVRDNREGIVDFFRETAETVGDVAGAADKVAKKVGGWDEAFKFGALLLSMKKLQGVAAAAGAGTGIMGAAGAAGLLSTRLLALSRLGLISIPIALYIYKDDLDRLNKWVLEKTGAPLWGGIQGPDPASGGQPARTTPQGTVPDPRGSGIAGLPTAGSGGGGGVSFSGGVTKPGAHVLAFVARVAAIYGAPLNISSGFRPGSRVKGTGAPSQHATGDAADIGPYGGDTLTRIGMAALIAAGMPQNVAYAHLSYAGTVNGVNILFNTNVGGNHFDHVHVGLSALPSAPKTAPTTVTPAADPAYTPATTTAETSMEKTGSGTKKAGIDAGERSRAISKASWIEDRADLITSPSMRARLRQRAANIAKTLEEVTEPKAFATAVRNLNALDRDWEKALELTSATKQAKATAKNIGVALGRMPDEMQKELGPKLAAVNRALGNVTSKGALAKIQKDMDAINAAIKAGVTKMQQTVERGRDTVGRAFGVTADKAMQVLDAKTEELLKKARVMVGGEMVGEGDLGPAGRALRDFRAARAAAALAAARAARLAELSTAKAEETEEEKAERLRQLAAYHAEIALEDREAELERLASLEADAAATALEAERARIRDERTILKERFQARYDEIVRGFQNETLTAEQAQQQLLALLGDPAWSADFANAGALIGQAFANSFTNAISGLAAAVDALRQSINAVSDATGTPRELPDGSVEEAWQTALRVRSEGMNKKYAGLIAKARRQYVSPRSLVSGSAGGDGGSGGAPTIVLPPVQAVFNLDGQEFARATAQPITDEQARIIGYRQQAV